MRMLRRISICVVGVSAFCLGMLGQARQDLDLVVSGGTVVTMDGARAILRDGSVAVRGDAIVAVGPRAEVEARYNGAQTIDPNTLQNDQTLAKIDTCGAFLSGMLLSGAFSDNASCH